MRVLIYCAIKILPKYIYVYRYFNSIKDNFLHISENANLKLPYFWNFHNYLLCHEKTIKPPENEHMY